MQLFICDSQAQAPKRLTVRHQLLFVILFLSLHLLLPVIPRHLLVNLQLKKKIMINLVLLCLLNPSYTELTWTALQLVHSFSTTLTKGCCHPCEANLTLPRIHSGFLQLVKQGMNATLRILVRRLGFAGLSNLPISASLLYCGAKAFETE